MMHDLDKIIDSYPDEYIAIKRQAKKYLGNGSGISETGRINILYRPWVASMNWGLMLYKGADMHWIHEAEKEMEKSIPDFYQRFLTNINGCFLYDLSLFGLIQSLSRSFLQCHSLLSANQDWIQEFDVDQSFFHFGGGTYSPAENTGYFYGKQKIISVRKNGMILHEWHNFSDFLHDELLRAETEMLKEVPKNIKLFVTD